MAQVVLLCVGAGAVWGQRQTWQWARGGWRMQAGGLQTAVCAQIIEEWLVPLHCRVGCLPHRRLKLGVALLSCPPHPTLPTSPCPSLHLHCRLAVLCRQRQCACTSLMACTPAWAPVVGWWAPPVACALGWAANCVCWLPSQPAGPPTTPGCQACVPTLSRAVSWGELMAPIQPPCV